LCGAHHDCSIGQQRARSESTARTALDWERLTRDGRLVDGGASTVIVASSKSVSAYMRPVIRYSPDACRYALENYINADTPLYWSF
jgi:hypothetical protein